MSMVPVAMTSADERFNSIQRELFDRNRQLYAAEAKIAELEADLILERQKSKSVERGAVKLRQVLTPLHQAIGMVFGEIDAMGVSGAAGESPAPVSADPSKSAAWDSWKQKMGGAARTIIDLLMLHGQLTQEQMRIHIGTKRMQTVYDATSKLNKAGLVVKTGDKFSLKEL